MNKFFHTYWPNFRNPVSKIVWAVFVILVLTLLLLTAGYFTGQALYNFTH